MDAHENEYLAAIEGMDDLYGAAPTPPMCVTVGSRRVPMWNTGARVCWTERGQHRHGIVLDIRYPGDDREPDQRIYVVRTRDPISLQRRVVELTHDVLIEW